MGLLTLGINYKTAPLDVREQLAIVPGEMPERLKLLHSQEAVNEAVLLSTCNRTEIYTDSYDHASLKKWLGHHWHLDDQVFKQYGYCYQGVDAMRHMLQVAVGLDSMMLGEPQILGQMKQAYQTACQAGCVGESFKHLFPAMFAASKQIRSQTAIGESSVSVAYALVQLAKKIFSDLSQCSVLLIGTGEIMQLVATHLNSQGIKKLWVAGRTTDKAHNLAGLFAGYPIRIGDIPNYLSQADIVVSATASQLPLLGKGAVEIALKSRKHRPILMLDLAVPRDIEPQIAELHDVYLYNIDDLQQVVASNLESRAEAAKQARAIIEIQTQNYLRQLRVMNAGDLIASFRGDAYSLRDQQLLQALAKLKNGEDPEQVLTLFAHSLTNKLLHKPTVNLRQAASDEKMDLLLLTKELYELE